MPLRTPHLPGTDDDTKPLTGGDSKHSPREPPAGNSPLADDHKDDVLAIGSSFCKRRLRDAVGSKCVVRFKRPWVPLLVFERGGG